MSKSKDIARFLFWANLWICDRVRQRDKVKDDAIAQLSDQLVSLSDRLQEIERRQDVGVPDVML